LLQLRDKEALPLAFYVCYNKRMNIVNKAYKYRFYPTRQQKEQLAQSFGCARFVYNYFLRLRTDAYYNDKKKFNYHKMSSLLTQLKNDKEHLWLKEVSSVSLQQSLRDLDKAFTNFFSKRAKYPRFKKKNSRQSVRYTKGGFSIKNSIVTIAKSKEPLKIRWSRRFSGKPSSITISKDSSGRYFVSFLVKEQVDHLPKIDKSVGIDVGVKDVCVTSNGFKSGAPKYLRRYEKQLALKQKELSRKKKGSRNRDKARLRVAKIHSKISDSRNDFNNKLTTMLIRKNQAIAVESLNIKGMIKNHKLAKSIADSSWYDFFRKLEYKSKWYGRNIIEIDKWFPSSKRCNHCGYIKEHLALHERQWICPSCQTSLDRDVNAAKNILTAGLAGLAFGENVRLTAEQSTVS